MLARAVTGEEAARLTLENIIPIRKGMTHVYYSLGWPISLSVWCFGSIKHFAIPQNFLMSIRRHHVPSYIASRPGKHFVLLRLRVSSRRIHVYVTAIRPYPCPPTGTGSTPAGVRGLFIMALLPFSCSNNDKLSERRLSRLLNYKAAMNKIKS